METVLSGVPSKANCIDVTVGAEPEPEPAPPTRWYPERCALQ